MNLYILLNFHIGHMHVKAVSNDAKTQTTFAEKRYKIPHLLGQTKTNHISRQSSSCDLEHLWGLMGAVCVFTAGTLA